MFSARSSSSLRFAGLVMLAWTVFLSACAAPRQKQVAGVYVLDGSAVRDLATKTLDELDDPNQQLAMGMALTMLQSLNIRLHLEPNGTAFVTGIQPAPSGTWSVDGERVTTLMGTPGDDAGRMEAILTDGTLVVDAGGLEGLPFQLVFRRAPEQDAEPIAEPRDVVDPEDIQSE